MSALAGMSRRGPGNGLEVTDFLPVVPGVRRIVVLRANGLGDYVVAQPALVALRAAYPDATITLDFMLARLTGVIDKLLVYPDRMARNLDRMGGLVHSQRVLLALTQAGVSREDAYRLVQRSAMRVWESDEALSLLDLLKADVEVTLDDAALEALFDLAYHMKHIDLLFDRVFGGTA